MQKINKGMLFTTITFLYSSILYFLVFYVFGEFNNYVLCTRIELFDSSIFGIDIKYLYTRSCDEEPYFIVFENIKNLYTIEDFQYRNRPVFLISAYIINKFITLFNLSTQNITIFQLSYFILQNLILTVTAIFLNISINVKNNIKNYSITVLFLLLSPIFKWTIFEAGSHTQTGLIMLLGIIIYKKQEYLCSIYLPFFVSFMYLSHRSFFVLYLYCVYLMMMNNSFIRLKTKNIILFTFYFLLPIISYEVFKYFFTVGQDHNVEIYNQFIWVFDFIRGFDTNGVTGWYCQQLPQNFKCYFNDNLSTLKYLYIPFMFIILYLWFQRRILFRHSFWRPLLEMFLLINLFWSFIGWYPPVRFSFYSWGNLIIFILIIIFYDLTTVIQKTLFTIAYILFFIILNHYNADLYFESNNLHLASAMLFSMVLFVKNRQKTSNVEMNYN